jgi:hypothetical protein
MMEKQFKTKGDITTVLQQGNVFEMSLALRNNVVLRLLLSETVHQYLLEGVDVPLKKKLAQTSENM